MGMPRGRLGGLELLGHSRQLRILAAALVPERLELALGVEGQSGPRRD